MIAGEFPGTIGHRVREGDTVESIASLYGSSRDAIVDVNGLSDSGLLTVGQRIAVPVRIVVDPTTAFDALTPIPTVEGEQETETPEPIVTPEPDITYTVRPGDTLSGIARRFNTTVGALSRLNGIANTNRIDAGDVLIISLATTSTQESVDPTKEPAETEVPDETGGPTVHVVTRGDSLYRLSLQYGVTMRQIVEVNNIQNVNFLFVGQEIIIPE